MHTPGQHLRPANFATCACLTHPPRLVHHPLPRPDKNTLDQQLGKSDFVELRRAELERYLRKLAAHPVVGASEVGGWAGSCRGGRVPASSVAGSPEEGA